MTAWTTFLASEAQEYAQGAGHGAIDPGDPRPEPLAQSLGTLRLTWKLPGLFWLTGCHLHFWELPC